MAGRQLRNQVCKKTQIYLKPKKDKKVGPDLRFRQDQMYQHRLPETPPAFDPEGDMPGDDSSWKKTFFNLFMLSLYMNVLIAREDQKFSETKTNEPAKNEHAKANSTVTGIIADKKILMFSKMCDNNIVLETKIPVCQGTATRHPNYFYSGKK